MAVLVDREVLVHYAQVSLISSDSRDYPQWETGTEPYVFNETGVAVAVETDIKIRVIVSTKSIIDGHLLGSTKIMVGEKGLSIGNELSGDLHQVSWQPGGLNIMIYIDDAKDLPKTVEFVLEKE